MLHAQAVRMRRGDGHCRWRKRLGRHRYYVVVNAAKQALVKDKQPTSYTVDALKGRSLP